MALNKLPRINEIIPVYAVIACLIYGWTILVFLWKLPAWIYFLNFTEILAIFSYSLATNVVESILLLVVMVALALILPHRLLLDVFVLRSTIVVICLAGGVMLMLALYPFANEFLFGRFPGWIVLITLVAGAMLWLDRLSRRVPAVASKLRLISDRLIIFLYFIVPLSLLALVVVVARNLG